MQRTSRFLIPIALFSVPLLLGACNPNAPSAPDVEMSAPATEPNGPTSLALGSQSNGRGDGPIIWVYGQQLFYDSIVTADPLPMKGPFQELEVGGPSPNGLQTQYGPGDQQYVGGRWWMDVNGNGEMDEGDHYFSCPLLGPGRDTALP